MSKIICDMCGTSYPDTADQCPICGCVRPVDVAAVDTDPEAGTGAGEYTFVKGGRFSKNNVKKRNKGKPQEPMPDYRRQDEEPHRNGGMIVLICLVLLAVVAVAAFIVIRFFWPNGSGNTVSTQPSTEVLDTTQIPCTDLVLENPGTVTLTDVAYQLSVYAEPFNTTDVITYSSNDEKVVTVDENGLLTPVSGGTAVITVTCGEKSVQCTVNCEKAPEESTDPTEDTTESTEEPLVREELRLNRKDITMVMKGEKWKLYDGQIPVEEITWSSDDEKIAVLKDGVVEAKGKGTTNVHAEYGDQKVSCIIRCSFEESSGGLTGTGGVGEDGGDTGSNGGDSGVTYSFCAFGTPLAHNDMTINGEQGSITFRDSNGNVIDVTWESTDTSVFTVLKSGNGCTLKPVASGTAKLKVVYEGETYLCIVRVSL